MCIRGSSYGDVENFLEMVEEEEVASLLILVGAVGAVQKATPRYPASSLTYHF